jgi:ATP-dependent RNA helicase RhlE
MSFKDFGLDPKLLRAVEELGFEQPTPIQKDAIPPAMQGRDLLACAMTGSGKTAAFLLPVLQRLAGLRRGTTRVLVISPTRELAAQIDEHRALLARHTGVTGAAVFGGVGMGPQERAFKNGVDVLVATPGRLLDHFQYPYARLDKIDVLILDEADRMLDMGFLPDIRRVLKHLPRERQTLLFSATMPPPIAELAREMLRNPVTLNIERQSKPATGITHAAYPIAQHLKSPLLLHLLKTGEMQSVVAFTRTKHRADRLANYLSKNGIECARIHGNRSQNQRTEALAGFKNGQYRVLVATDIAARGIDVEALSHVVNFDVPHVADDYIHRVGRTARAEATGDAFTFVSDEEIGDLRDIEKALGQPIPRLKAPGFDTSAVQAERPETPIGERIAAIRARKAEDRARAVAKAARKQQNQQSQPAPAQRGNGRAPYPRPAASPAGARSQQGRSPARPAGSSFRPLRGT